MPSMLSQTKAETRDSDLVLLWSIVNAIDKSTCCRVWGFGVVGENSKMAEWSATYEPFQFVVLY